MTITVPQGATQKAIDAFIVKSQTLQNAQTGNGNGTDFDITGMGTVQLLINPTSWTGTVTFKASLDGVTFINIQGKQQDTALQADNVANPGSTASIWSFQVAGLTKFRVVTSNAGGTSVTVAATASPYIDVDPLDVLPGDNVAMAGQVPSIQMGQTGTTTSSVQRLANKIINVAAVAITAGTAVSVWTPASGKKFRVLGYHLSSTAASSIILKDGTASNTAVEFMRTPIQAVNNGTPSPNLGNGFLSAAANNQLWLDVSASGTIHGFIVGIEE